MSVHSRICKMLRFYCRLVVNQSKVLCTGQLLILPCFYNMNIVPHPDIQVSRITKKNVHFSLEYSWSFSKQTFGFIYAINDQHFLVIFSRYLLFLLSLSVDRYCFALKLIYSVFWVFFFCCNFQRLILWRQRALHRDSM